MKSKNKVTKVALAAAILTIGVGILITTPANAASNTTSSGLQNPTTQPPKAPQIQPPNFNQILQNLQQQFTQFTGALRIPDVGSMLSSTIQQVMSGGNAQDAGLTNALSGTETPTFGDALKIAQTDILKAVAVADTNTELGQPAQQQHQQEMQTAKGLEDQSIQAAQTSQSLNVSQDILKQLSTQLASLAGLQNQTAQYTRQNLVEQAAGRQLTAITAKETMGMNQKEQRQTMGDAAFVSRQAGLGLMPGATPLVQSSP